MVVTVTINPTLDKTGRIDCLEIGDLNRMQDIRLDPSGKGINVSRMLRQVFELPSVATGFLGGGNGETIRSGMTEWGVAHDFVQVGGNTRSNLKVLDRDGRITELNEPGPQINQMELDSLFRKLDSLVGENTLLVLSGSLSPGVETDLYARLVRLGHSRGGRVFLDADGEAFRLALEEKPDFIKPNRREILEYFHEAPDTGIQRLTELCLSLTDRGITGIALSMGAQGALFVNGDSVLQAPALPVAVGSTVGAGDAMMSAFVCAAVKGIPWEDAAVLSMASASATVMTRGTQPPSREMVDGLMDQVVMKRI